MYFDLGLRVVAADLDPQANLTMAQESHKPIFHLKPADGAIGAHVSAVKNVYKDFKTLAHKIADRVELVLPNLKDLSNPNSNPDLV